MTCTLENAVTRVYSRKNAHHMTDYPSMPVDAGVGFPHMMTAPSITVTSAPFAARESDLRVSSLLPCPSASLGTTMLTRLPCPPKSLASEAVGLLRMTGGEPKYSRDDCVFSVLTLRYPLWENVFFRVDKTRRGVTTCGMIHYDSGPQLCS